MNDKNYLVRGNPFSNSVFLYKSLFFYCLFILSAYFIYLGISSEPFISFREILIGGTAIIIILIIAVYDIKDRYFIKVTTSQILLKNIFGSKIIIERSEVLSYFERKRIKREKGGRLDSWLELKLYLENSSYIFSSKEYSNYAQIKTVLTKNIPSLVRTLTPLEDDRQDYLLALRGRLFRRGFWIILVLIFPFVKHFYKKYTKSDISYEKLIELRGKIAEYPDLLTSGKYDTEYGFNIKLEGFSSFNFVYVIEDFSSKNDYNVFRDKIKKGETIGIYISKDEYEKKISHEKQIKFNDKYFDFNEIKAFGAKYNGIDLKTYGYWRRKKVEIDEDDKDPLTLYNYAFMYIYIGILAFLLIYFSQDLREYNIEKDM